MSIEKKTKSKSYTEYDSVTGLVRNARQIASPNFDERPEGEAIEAVIIHAISLPPGEYGGNHVENLFCNQLEKEGHPYFAEIAEIKVSAHFYINRSGELIQFVPVHKRAWHAGVSSCMGRQAVNDFSIGIELEGCDDDGFEEAQYRTLVALTHSLISGIPALTSEHIYGHQDIAPGRKTDPGPGFNWKAYRAALSEKEIKVATNERDGL